MTGCRAIATTKLCHHVKSSRTFGNSIDCFAVLRGGAPFCSSFTPQRGVVWGQQLQHDMHAVFALQKSATVRNEHAE